MTIRKLACAVVWMLCLGGLARAQTTTSTCPAGCQPISTTSTSTVTTTTSTSTSSSTSSSTSTSTSSSSTSSSTSTSTSSSTTSSTVTTTTLATSNFTKAATGATASDNFLGVAKTSGNKVVAGGYFKSATFVTDLGSLTLVGGACGVVVQYSATGVAEWQTKACSGATGQETQVTAVSAFANGDVAVAGYFQGTMTMDGRTVVQTPGTGYVPDMFVARLASATGNVTWLTRFGGPADDRLQAIAVDASDRVTVGGFFRGTMAVGTFNLVNENPPAQEGCLFQVAGATGVPTWAIDFTPIPASEGGASQVYHLAADASGNVIIGGQFSNAIRLPGASVNLGPALGGFTDAFVASVTSGGAFRWQSKYGANDGNEAAKSVAVDGAGNVYSSGNAIKTFTLAGTQTAVGGTDAIVAKWAAASGVVTWAKRFGGAGNDYGNGVAVDTGGAVLVGISTGNNPLTIGSFTPTCATCGANDVVTAKLNATDGTPLTAKRFGGPAADEINKLVSFGVDEVGVGYFYTSLTANGVTVNATGASDAWVVRTVVTP